jgi:hypothetical protein
MIAGSTVVGIVLLIDTHAAAASVARWTIVTTTACTGSVDTRFSARADMTASATVVGIGLQIRLTTIVQVAIAVAKSCIAANAACAS